MARLASRLFGSRGLVFWRVAAGEAGSAEGERLPARLLASPEGALVARDTGLLGAWLARAGCACCVPEVEANLGGTAATG
jgi:hypothetical protein